MLKNEKDMWRRWDPLWVFRTPKSKQSKRKSPSMLGSMRDMGRDFFEGMRQGFNPPGWKK